MKLLWECGPGEYGTPMEKANAVIRNFMHSDDDYNILTSDMYEFYIRELTEFVEHIEVYLKHNRYE